MINGRNRLDSRFSIERQQHLQVDSDGSSDATGIREALVSDLASQATNASFVRTSDPIGDIGSFDNRLVFGDFDGDGDADVFYQNGSAVGAGFGYKVNNGNGTFTDVGIAASPFRNADLSTYNLTAGSAFAIDYDGDGDVDLVDRNNNTSGVFQNNGGLITRISDPIGDIGLFDARLVFGDFDVDGDLDVFYQNGNAVGSGFGYKVNNGNGTFTDVALGASPFRNVDFTNYNILSQTLFVIDYDNDGDDDLVDRTNNSSGVFQNNGGIISRVADPIGDIGPVDSRLVFGDFDSDGDSDIFYQNGTTAGAGFGYKVNNGNGTFTDVPLASSPFAGVSFSGFNLVPGSMFAVDVDADGDVDLVDRTNNASGVFVQAGAPPRLASSTPSDNGTNVALNANIVVTFTEAVTQGTGSIRIVRTSDNVVVETIAVNSGQVTGSGATWTINPSITLSASTAYAVRFDPGTFVDNVGAIFRGVADNTTLNFVTQAAPSPPVVTTIAGSANFTEGQNVAGLPVAVDPGLTVTDSDSATLVSATVSITSGLNAAQDVLALSATSGIGNIAASYSNGVLTLSSAGATATLAQWQVALRSVTYANTSDVPSTATRTVSFVVNDGQANSPAATRSVTVTPVNDAPSQVANAGSTVAEGGTDTITASELDYSDPEQADSAITYTLTSLATNGVLRLNGTAIALNGTFTQDDINNGRVTFLHDGGETTSASFEFSVSDGQGGNVLNRTFAFTVTPVNDAPSQVANAGSTVAEGGTDTITASELDYSDPEQSDSAITYTLTSLATNGVLRLNGTAIALNGTFTQDDINNNRVTFLHDGGEAASASFGFSVSDVKAATSSINLLSSLSHRRMTRR